MAKTRATTLSADALADVIATVIREAIKPIEARIAALEAHTAAVKTVKWGGVYQRHVHHDEGSLATHDGSLWLATRDTEDPPGTPDSGWRLIVKRGAYTEKG